MAFNSIGKLLPQRLRQAGLEREVQISQVIIMANDLLNELFGPQTTDYKAQAVSLKQKNLSIAAMNSSMRQELAIKERDFIFRLNKKIGKQMVERLRIVI